MADSEDFHHERREWSERKHTIMVDYLAAASQILGKQAGEVVFVDGFAGQGYFEDGTAQSSVLSAELARQVAERGKYILRCVNVESDKASFDKLQAATSSIAPGLVVNLHGTFTNCVADILKYLGDAPSVVLLDPFGVVDIPWRGVEPFLRRPKTDVLINFMGNTAARLAGFIDSPQAPMQGGMIRTLNGIMGSEQWQGTAKQAASGQMIEAMCDAYRRRLSVAGRYVCSYDVRSAEGRYKYTMMFAAAHPLPFKIMNDTFYKTERSYERAIADLRLRIQQKSGHQLDMFSTLDQEPTRPEVEAWLVDQLKSDIMQIFQGRAVPRQRLELRRDLWQQGWFGRARSTDHDRAIAGLLRDKKLVSQKGKQHEYDLISVPPKVG